MSIAVGLNKGHAVTKREKKAKPSQRKGVSAALFARVCCFFL